MDPQKNSAHNNPVRQNSERNNTSRATALHPISHVHEEVVEFNHSYSALILEREVKRRFPTEKGNIPPSLERELYTSELLAEKKEAFESLLARNQNHLQSLGLSISLIFNTTSTTDFHDEDASLHLDSGERFIEYLASYQGNPIHRKDLTALVSTFDDLFLYLQYHADLTDPDDARSIEFVASLRGLLSTLKNIPEFQHTPTLSMLARYQSFLERRCLHEVIMVERANIFEIGSLRLNESGTEFIHIPFSIPSLRWHIICNNSKNYAQVWQSSLAVLDLLLSRPSFKQLSELALTTTLENLRWIKQDLNSNGWSLRDDGETEEFKIVVDEIAERISGMLQSIR